MVYRITVPKAWIDCIWEGKERDSENISEFRPLNTNSETIFNIYVLMHTPDILDGHCGVKSNTQDKKSVCLVKIKKKKVMGINKNWRCIISLECVGSRKLNSEIKESNKRWRWVKATQFKYNAHMYGWTTNNQIEDNKSFQHSIQYVHNDNEGHMIESVIDWFLARIEWSREVKTRLQRMDSSINCQVK